MAAGFSIESTVTVNRDPQCIASFWRRLPRSRTGVALIRCYRMVTPTNPSPGPSPPSRDNDWGEKGRGWGILIQSGMVAENRAPPRHETGGACNVLFR